MMPSVVSFYDGLRKLALGVHFIDGVHAQTAADGKTAAPASAAAGFIKSANAGGEAKKNPVRLIFFCSLNSGGERVVCFFFHFSVNTPH